MSSRPGAFDVPQSNGSHERTRIDREGYDPVQDLWFVLHFLEESAN